MKTNVKVFGAFIKGSERYVHPCLANKNDEYVCTSCFKDVIFRNGEINRPHFAHKKSDDPCKQYISPGESQIHKDAKMLLKYLVDNKYNLIFERICKECNKISKIKLPNLDEDTNVIEEYRFEHLDSNRIADVALVKNNQPIFIFEIFNTHKTDDDDRPEPWVELDASKFLDICYKNLNEEIKTITLPCIRKYETCKKCLDYFDKYGITMSIPEYMEYEKKHTLYLQVDYKNRDIIKNIGGKWNPLYSSWNISKNKYNKNKEILEDIAKIRPVFMASPYEQYLIEEGLNN